MQPKEWWGNPKNAQKWIAQNKRRTEEPGINSTRESTRIVVDEIIKRFIDFEDVLEVGAGDGRLIGKLSKNLIRCCSCDINEELNNYIKEKYTYIDANVGEITNLPFDDNSIDLVFTYQVLQHVPPKDIDKAIKELCRVAKKEVWMWEGIGRVDYPHCAKSHNAHGGSWVYHIDKIVDCYEVSVPKNENITLDRQRLYKVKV